MTKRILALLMSMMLVVAMVPTTAFAAAGTWDVDLVVSKNTGVKYNGQETVEIGFGVQSDDLTLSTAQSIVFAVDLNVFDFVYAEGATATSYTDMLAAGSLAEVTDVVYSKYQSGSGPSAIKWDAKVYVAKKGSTGFMAFQPNCTKDTPCQTQIILASILFGLKSGKSEADITSSSIRLATVDEARDLAQGQVIFLTDGKAGGQVQQYGTTVAGNPDTLTGTVQVKWDGITPTEPPKPLPTCVAPTGITAEFGAALATVALPNPAGNTSGSWEWMNGAQRVGNVKDNPHTYKARFVPNDTTAYQTVEDIDVEVTATKVTLSAGSPIMLPITETYTGSPIEPTPTIKTAASGDTLVLGQDYEITKYEDNTDVGTGKIFIAPLTDGNYSFAASSYNFEIKAAGSSISITGDPGKAYNGSAVADPAVSVTGSAGAVTCTYYTDASCTTETNAANSGAASDGAAPKNAGDYWVKATVAGDANYAGATSDPQAFTITRAAYTFTYAGTTAAAIGQARPTSDPAATASGVGGESVSGTLTWYADSAYANPASGNFTATGTEELYWQFVPAASETNYVVDAQTGSATFTVSELPAQSVAFADPGPVAKTFGDTNFTNTATNSTSGGGGAITYSVDNPAVAEVDASTGEVTIKGAGTATITATAAAAPGYAETKANYTLNVSPMTITPAIVLTPAAFEYDGTDKEPAVAVNDGALVLTAADYTVAYENNRNAGTAKVIVKPAAGGNYTWTPDAEQTFAITPKALDQSAFTWSTAVSFPYDGNAHSVTLTNLPAGVSVVYTDNTKTYVGSYTASAVLNVDANHTLTGTLATCAWGITPTADPAVIGAAAAVLTGKTVDLSTNVTGAMGNVSYAIDTSAALAGCSVDPNTGIFTAGTTGGSCTVTVTVAAKDVDGDGTDEYSGATGSITVTVQEKTEVSAHISFPNGKLTYNGSEQTYENASIDGITPGANPTWTYTYTAVSGTLSGGKPKTAGTYTVSATYEDDDNYGTANATLTIRPVRVAIPAADTTVHTYDGTAKTYDIAATADYTVAGNIQTNANEAGYTVTVALTDKVNTVWEDDTTTDRDYTFKIMKAVPTGSPDYTAINAAGKTLGDAALTIGTITPTGGTLAWDDGDSHAVVANTPYGWTYTPADPANYKPLTGSITPYVVTYYGGGGSYTPSYSVTVEKTANGTINVSHKNAISGETVTITAKPDAGYELSRLIVLDNKNSEQVLTAGLNGAFTFRMPASPVTIKAVFAESAAMMFDDVAADAYYFEAVKWAIRNGVTNGIGNNLFGSDDPCTRAQIVTFLWRAAGSPEPRSMAGFTDVPADAFYAKAVAWAVENGITTGTGDGKFSPDDTCSRAQSVTFLYRASGSPAVSGIAEFSDVAPNAYYADAVAWAAKKRITTGIGGGLFGSDDDCTRAQIVTFLWRAMVE